MKRKDFYAAARRSLFWVRIFKESGEQRLAEKAWESFKRDRALARTAA